MDQRAQKLIAAFQSFDADGSGRVNTAALRIVLTNMGNPLTPQELAEFVADADQDGWIDYVSFVKNVIFAT